MTSRLNSENLKSYPEILTLQEDLIRTFEKFDNKWCLYEWLYITELMAIETDARRFIMSSIILESSLAES